jgi:hypothetical protein
LKRLDAAMTNSPVPTYAFDFGLGIPYGRGLPWDHGYVQRTTEAPGRVASGLYAFRLDELTLARTLGEPLTRFSADAINLATAIYVADRLSPRHDQGIERLPGERWPRRLRLRIPLREPGRWATPIVREGLERLLHFWTDDDWCLTFVPRSALLGPRAAEVQRPLLAPAADGGATVVLHSGGLDGTLGLIDAIRRANGRLVVPASVTTNRRTRMVQDRVLAAAAGALRLGRPDLAGARVYANLSLVRRSQQESTQRGRALLYLTVGAISALQRGNGSFTVAEHGVGAINLPYTPDQIGARTTKAVHPVALARFAQIFSVAAGRPVAIDNPLFWLTKGESSASLTPDLVPIVRETVTCDRFPRIDASHACGRCSNCIVRRAALAGIGWDAVDGPAQRVFEFDPVNPDAVWEGCDLVPLFAVRGQVEELGLSLASANPWEALVAAYPELHDVVTLRGHWGITATEVQARLTRLYRAYVREMNDFFATIPQPGWRHDSTTERASRHGLAATA